MRPNVFNHFHRQTLTCSIFLIKSFLEVDQFRKEFRSRSVYFFHIGKTEAYFVQSISSRFFS